MRMPPRETRPAPRRYDAARVQVHCPETAAHARQLILAQATIYPDGWARWVEEDCEYCGYLQLGPCCDPPEVSAL